MFKKLLTILTAAVLVCPVAFGQPSVGTTYHEIQIIDEMGEKVTDITSVSIYNPGTTTESTIYAGRNGTLAMTNPVLADSGSTNSTLSSGYMYWWGPGNYDFSMTDGTNTHTNSGHRDRTASEGRIAFPSYLTSISSTTYDDDETITLGTGADWVINAGTTDDLLTFVPATDGAVFRIGTSGTTVNADFEVYTGSGVGLLINEGTSTFGITGLTTSINASSNYATNINTGTSTGAVTIGSGTSGAWAIDGTTTGTLNADDSIGITTTEASADITIDATAGSVIIDAAEAAADAILIKCTTAAGGIDITSHADIDMTTTGASGEDISITNTGGSVIITATEAAADAIVLNASTAVGGIDITSNADIDITTTGAATEDINITNTGGSIIATATENVQGAIHIEANGGTSESINIYSNQGSGASATTEHDASIQLQSDAGGISLYTTGDVADAIRIETNGGVDEFITINNLKGTGADAITIAANAAGGDVNIDSVLGRIEIEAEEDVANAIYIIADGATASTIEIFNDTGTSVTEDAAAIQLLADVGGICIQSDADLDDALVLRVDGGTTSEMTLHNDRGDTTDSIELLSDAGGITLNAAKPVAITNAFEPDIVLVPDGAAYDVLANNSGQIHIIQGQTADITLDLPAEADGLNYRFVYVGGAADAQDWLIDTENNTNFFYGGIVQHDPDDAGDDTEVYYSDGDSNSIIGVLTPECGTEISIWCDGTNWYLTGTVISATDAGVTFADQ